VISARSSRGAHAGAKSRDEARSDHDPGRLAVDDWKALAGAMALLLVPVANSIGDGSRQRVKACRAPDCHWAFYDRSRNHSGVWCKMAVCGNRTKVRTYRARPPRDR